ncbi:hypothetical protein MANY_38070 [Mycolicibacterium anyangense]|uniref:DUF485 domain-containing protein n=1 Tax=Mycolicibacterium anyangense TaxID=1431246 RepID=A0A6N4W8W8_9MYCO|nr:hypothetical protein MANY_38070 [Mycolicibacterium anyangense]
MFSKRRGDTAIVPGVATSKKATELREARGMGEQGQKRRATVFFSLFYDRRLRRRAASLYYWIAALVFAGLAVWVLTPYAPFTPDSAGMSASMKILTTGLGSVILFGLSVVHVVLARRVNADSR